ncbi:MAG: hypothetical protein WC254_00930 [Candidatus Woesearchaeota archaeon]|jgi:hypothetical protein
MPKEIRIGDEILYRYPSEGSAPLVDCYAECEQAGLVVASGKYIAKLRATYNETDSPAWKYLKGFTSSIAGIGCLDSQPMIVVAHTNHPLMTSDVIRKFKADHQRKPYLYGIILHQEEVLDVINRYRNVETPTSDIFVLEGPSATSLILGDTVDATIDETKRTLLRPYLGDNRILEDYLKGLNNNHRMSGGRNTLLPIGAFLSMENFINNYLTFNHLWFGNYQIRGDLDGELHRESFFRYDSCVFGIKPKR